MIKIMSQLAFLAFVGSVISCSAAQNTSFYNSNGSCIVSWADTESGSLFKTAVSEQNCLVYMQLSFEGSDMAINGSSQAFRWIRTRGRQGNGLLFLKEHFEVLSLYSLAVGIKRLNIPLRDQPTGCFFMSTNYTDLEDAMCRLILTDFNFQTSNQRGSSWYDNEKVCNFRIINKDGKPEYKCCQFNDKGNLDYSILEADLWVDVLIICIFILTIIVTLYSPKVFPVSFYSMAYGDECYEHKLPNKIQIKILKTETIPETEDKSDNVVIDSFALKKMPKLKQYVQTMPLNQEKVITVDKVHIMVLKRRLVPEDDVPIDVVHSLYESLVQCKIRRREAFTHCCRSNIFPFDICNVGKQWHDVLKVIMHFVLIGIICLPYLLRLLFYYYVERPYIDSVRDMAKNRQWINNVIFTGSVTSLLGPDHAFLITVYVVLGLAVLVMFVMMCAGQNITANLIFVIQNCLRDMSDKSRVYKVINWAVKVLLSPFTFLGVAGVLIAPFYWLLIIPLVVVILICNIFPAVYLFIRLFANFLLPYLYGDITSKTRISCGIEKTARLIKSSESVRKWLYIEEFTEIVKGTYMYTAAKSLKRRYTNICLQGLFTVFCMFVVLAILFLALDVILLVTEIVVYTSIGIILNATFVFKYVILALSLLFYARDCINSVRKKYLAFNKIVLPAVRDMSDGVLDVANQDENDQQNTAFILNVPYKDAKNPSMILKDQMLHWRLHQVIVFLDKHDTPYITESFFFKTCEMPYEKCPGRFLENFVKVLFEIFMVFLFLFFVSLVILAFGENYRVSATNQTLATLAGSFLPLLLRKYFFKDHSDVSIDTSKIKFTTCLNDTIASYTQEWPVADIEACGIEENDKSESLSTMLIVECDSDSDTNVNAETNLVGDSSV